MRIIGILTLCCLVVIGCHNQESKSTSSVGKYDMSNDALAFEEEMEMEPPRTSQPRAAGLQQDQEGKIIRNGYMNFEVTRLESVKGKVDSILKQYKGYYESEKYNAYKYSVSYSLLLRVPNISFDALVYDLENGLGDLKTKNITAKDVTAEFVDLNIRLDNNVAYLDQYREILKRAKSVKEILEVQEKIRNIEEEIESKKGRLKYLNDKVNYSTLNLEISEVKSSDSSDEPSFGNRIANAFNNGIQGFLSFVVGLVNLWPFLILVILLYLGRRRIFSLLRKKKDV